MKESKELIKNTVIISIGKFGTKVLTFLLLPLYTSILTTSEYGVYDLLLTISLFLVPAITLLMEESMFRFLIDCKADNQKKEIISTCCIFIIINFIIFTIFYSVICMFFKIPYEFLFYIYILSSIFNALKNTLTRGMGKIKLYSLSNFISSSLIIILNILFIAVIKIGVRGLLLSYIIANILIPFITIVKLKSYKYIELKKYNKLKLKEMIRYSLPLVPNSISWTIINLSDRIIISSVMGTDSNGIYSVSNKFPSIIDTVYGFFYTAWKESAAKTLTESNHNQFYNSVYNAIKKFMWSVIVCVISVLPLIFDLIIKKDFVNAYIYIPVLIISIYFSNISGFYGGIFSAYKDTKIMGFTTFVAAIVNLVVNLIFIRYIGLWAAAFSTLISSVVTYLYRKSRIKNYIKLEENLKTTLVGSIVLIMAVYSFYNSNILINILIFILVIGYSIILNRNIIVVLFNIFKRKNVEVR